MKSYYQLFELIDTLSNADLRKVAAAFPATEKLSAPYKLITFVRKQPTLNVAELKKYTGRISGFSNLSKVVQRAIEKILVALDKPVIDATEIKVAVGAATQLYNKKLYTQAHKWAEKAERLARLQENTDVLSRLIGIRKDIYTEIFDGDALTSAFRKLSQDAEALTLRRNAIEELNQCFLQIKIERKNPAALRAILASPALSPERQHRFKSEIIFKNYCIVEALLHLKLPEQVQPFVQMNIDIFMANPHLCDNPELKSRIARAFYRASIDAFDGKNISRARKIISHFERIRSKREWLKTSSLDVYFLMLIAEQHALNGINGTSVVEGLARRLNNETHIFANKSFNTLGFTISRYFLYAGMPQKALSWFFKMKDSRQDEASDLFCSAKLLFLAALAETGDLTYLENTLPAAKTKLKKEHDGSAYLDLFFKILTSEMKKGIPPSKLYPAAIQELQSMIPNSADINLVRYFDLPNWVRARASGTSIYKQRQNQNR